MSEVETQKLDHAKLIAKGLQAALDDFEDKLPRLLKDVKEAFDAHTNITGTTYAHLRNESVEVRKQLDAAVKQLERAAGISMLMHKQNEALILDIKSQWSVGISDASRNAAIEQVKQTGNSLTTTVEARLTKIADHMRDTALKLNWRSALQAGLSAACVGLVMVIALGWYFHEQLSAQVAEQAYHATQAAIRDEAKLMHVTK